MSRLSWLKGESRSRTLRQELTCRVGDAGAPGERHRLIELRPQPTEDAANSYTAAQVLGSAVKAVGSLNQAALSNWLHSHTVATIVGPLKWDKAGVPDGSLLLAQWQDGALQVVAPAAAATSKSIVIAKPVWGNG